MTVIDFYLYFLFFSLFLPFDLCSLTLTTCPCSSTDPALVTSFQCGARVPLIRFCASATPIQFNLVLVVQRIEHEIADLKTQVRFLARAPVSNSLYSRKSIDVDFLFNLG